MGIIYIYMHRASQDNCKTCVRIKLAYTNTIDITGVFRTIVIRLSISPLGIFRKKTARLNDISALTDRNSVMISRRKTYT